MGKSRLHCALFFACEDYGHLFVFKRLCQGLSLDFPILGKTGISADPVLEVKVGFPVSYKKEVLNGVSDQKIPDPVIIGDVI